MIRCGLLFRKLFYWRSGDKGMSCLSELLFRLFTSSFALLSYNTKLLRRIFSQACVLSKGRSRHFWAAFTWASCVRLVIVFYASCWDIIVQQGVGAERGCFLWKQCVYVVYWLIIASYGYYLGLTKSFACNFRYTYEDQVSHEHPQKLFCIALALSLRCE